MNRIEKIFKKENLLKGDIGDVLYINEDGTSFIDMLYVTGIIQVQDGGIADDNLLIKVPYSENWKCILNDLFKNAHEKYMVDETKMFKLYTRLGKLSIEANSKEVKIGTFVD